ncbi:DUF4407 domain-containing protein [Pedobacter heparinus]|uniref:DUF4407 domain-containing protein n=1 Tax=Pedobacter heparinus (strain ATCC 13125 / DSM 2366 / CIP 104194 / JCM 7457 / NBRC 12017 / NCIMB 9290 / NRRL B-14731 / HIM 762-3) TaxID=485917 RepID=C6XY52_PEDHD|nr:DUF4407 domain-containing protein [Pedobacter heparinus]ACU02319.1 conserved hypothetical protein [Pedobacter heparinus DSM 2366]
MNAISRFFWFCSGAHLSTLEKHPTEHNKYIGIGATIFFTGLFAALSGGYAMYFVFKGDSGAVFFALFFGLIWGLAIFNMDRYIVSSINKNASTNKQILQATPRILLAIMIGVVISRPLELKIFDKEIKERLKVSYLNNQRSKIDTLNAAFENKYRIEMGKLNESKAQKDTMASAIKADRQKLNFEIFGNKTEETSGIMGYGPYAKRKEAELKQREQELDTLTASVRSQEAFVAGRKEFDGLMTEKLYTGKQLDSLTSLAGFADRNWALGQLSFNRDGTRDTSTYLAVTFIGLLFIFFECLPVFVKLMSSRGPYDRSVENTEETQVYESDKDKDYETAVIDGVHDTRVHTEIEKRKHKLYEQ